MMRSNLLLPSRVQINLRNNEPSLSLGYRETNEKALCKFCFSQKYLPTAVLLRHVENSFENCLVVDYQILAALYRVTRTFRRRQDATQHVTVASSKKRFRFSRTIRYFCCSLFPPAWCVADKCVTRMITALYFSSLLFCFIIANGAIYPPIAFVGFQRTRKSIIKFIYKGLRVHTRILYIRVLYGS